MSPEVPTSEVPPVAPSEQSPQDTVVEAAVIPEAPVLPEVPEVVADTPPPPVAEEAQIADRMVGSPLTGSPTADLTPGISFSDGPVPHQPDRPVMTTSGPGVVGLPGGVATSVPRNPEFSSPTPAATEMPVSSESPTGTVEPQQ